MIKYFAVVLIAVTTAVAVAACDEVPGPSRLQDQQIVCTLTGEAFIFIDGYEKSIHSIRRSEADPLCQPLKAKIVVGAKQ